MPITLNFDNTPIEIPTGVRTWFHRAPGRLESQRIIIEDDRVVGFNMLGSRWNQEVLLEWIHERRGLEWVLKRLPEAQFDEELTTRFRVHDDAVEVA